MPGASYSRVSAERGRGSRQPAELLEAEALIQHHLETHADDRGWMHAKGRADLLEGRYEEAIAELDLARDVESITNRQESDILTELATAYFERGRASNRAIDLSMAMELLGQALQSDPSSLVARYNQALVFQQAFFYPNASQEWKRYLEADHASPWADEARRHLAMVESRMQAPEPSAGRLDDLMELRLARIMAAGLSFGKTREVALRLREEHHDAWLGDALGSGELAVGALAKMVATRTGLQMGGFESELRDLELLSTTLHATPLRVWLDFERLFRITHSPHIAACMPRVDQLIETCRRRRYEWFLVQSLLERSSCEAVRGEFAMAEATDREALDIARRDAFPIAGLRAAGLLAGYLAAAGQYRDAAALQFESLGLYWSRPLPYARSQEFFHDMVLANEGLGRFHAAKAAAQAAAVMAQLSGVAMNEAVNRSRWAGFAFRLGLKQEATAQYTLAEKLFHGMASNPTVAAYQAFAEAFSALAGDPSALLRFEPIVKSSTNPFIVVSYLHTAATLAENAGRTAEARRLLEEAIGFVEKDESSPPASQNLMEWRDQLQGCYRDMTRVLLLQNDAAGAYHAWQRFLRADQRLQGFRDVPAAPTDGVAATVITFARLGQRYGVWVRSDDGVRFTWLPRNAAAVDREVRSYAALCADPEAGWNLVQAAGRSLRSELLGFALAGVPRNRLLLLQPDGELARLPWAALMLPGEADEQFLVAILPTPVAGPGPVKVPEIQVHRALIVGATILDPKLRAEFRPLPGIEDEIAAVSSAFLAADVLEGAKATAKNISARMESADALHFVGHAAMRRGRIRLLVAPDASDPGFWRPAVGGRLGLAVLSACSTAKYRDPEDPKPENLANALLLEGASQVVASLWDVDSSATSFFMQSFYRHLRLNHAPAAALREASAETRHQRAWSNPYYWASFSLFLRI